MIQKQAILFLISFLFVFGSFSQNKYTLSGYVKDGSSGEDIIGATIVIPSIAAGTYSNEYGFYSITIPEGDYQVDYRYIGYSTETKTIKLTSDLSMNIELRDTGGVSMEDVVILGKKEDENVSSTEMSTVTLSVQQARKLPALFGEVDVIKTIQLMPGVAAVGEGLSGYYVRGGNADHNLILLDEATVFNASHVLGFFSVFNPDALKDEIKLYKGGIPARYGGRLASTLDLRMKEGSTKRFHIKGGIGILSSRLNIEGPLKKDKGSFMISGRRTYADLFLKLTKNEDIKNSQAYFYDLNAKMNWRFSDKDRLFLSGYFGRDVFGFWDLFGNQWGNATGSLRWNHLFNDRLFSNTTFIFSDFNYGFNFNFPALGNFKFDAGIRDYTLKSDFTYFLNPKNKLSFGFSTTLHRFNQGSFIPEIDSSAVDSLLPDSATSLNALKIAPEYAIETGFYISNENKISDRLSIEYGARVSLFHNIGPGTEFDYGSDRSTILDSTQYKTGQLIKQHWGFEPRFSARYLVDEHSSLKFSYNRMMQYLHLASNATASWPWDIWIPSSKHIKPQMADQVALGYFRNFFDNQLETSVEIYAKDMRNQIDFKDGAELILNETIETEILAGRGWSYGAEFLLRKKYGKFSGWIGYTLSWTNRRVVGINDNDPYPAKNDRRHDVSIVTSYDINEVFNIAANWVYATGNATTFPSGKYNFGGNTVRYYPTRNSNRMPAFHRLDLAFNVNFGVKKERRFENSLNVSLYNAYGRKNAFAIEFLEDEDRAGELVATKTYLFRWVPSVTWNFSF